MDRLGIGLWGGMSVDGLVRTIGLAEDCGYESAFVIESFGDPFALLAGCAATTHRIRLGTGVATVFTREPETTVRAATTLSALTGGRFVLGLGVGHPEIHAVRDDVDRTRPAPFTGPLGRLRQVTELMRASAPEVPIWLGVLHPQALELAGELADGVISLFLPVDRIPAVRAAIARGARRAGRDPDAVTLAAYLPVCVDDDLEVARLAMRHHVGTSLASYGYYRQHFAAIGLGGLVEQARIEASSAMSALPDERLCSLIDDATLDRLVLSGPAGRCRDGIERYRQAGLDLPVVYPVDSGFRGYRPGLDVEAAIRAAASSLSR